MSKKRNADITIDPIALKNLITDNLNALWDSSVLGNTGKENPANLIPPIMVWGPPGVGKSTVIRDICKELKIGFIDVRLAQREPVDMRGLPVPDNDSVKWLVSSEWPRDPNSRGIILFDELTSADKTLQVAAYEFILDRRLGSLYKVPDQWYIMAAGNRAEDQAVACTMSSALANRFLHVEIEPTLASFLAWAKKANIHPAVISYLQYRPHHLFIQEGENLQRGWPSPRSWERVSTMLKIIEANRRKSSLKYVIPGLIGRATAAEFNAFYKTSYSNINQDIAESLVNGTPIVLPTQADMLHACCGNVLYHIKTCKEPEKFPAMAENFLKFILSLTNDFAAMTLNEAEDSLKGSKRWQIISNHPLFMQVKDKLQVKNPFKK